MKSGPLAGSTYSRQRFDSKTRGRTVPTTTTKSGSPHAALMLRPTRLTLQRKCRGPVGGPAIRNRDLALRVLIEGHGGAPLDEAQRPRHLQTMLARDVRQTIKIAAPNLCGKSYVVVDSATGSRVVTLMVPGK